MPYRRDAKANTTTELSNAEAIAHLKAYEANVEDRKKLTIEFIQQVKRSEAWLSNDQVKECLLEHEVEFNESCKLRYDTIQVMKARLEENPSMGGIIDPVHTAVAQEEAS